MSDLRLIYVDDSGATHTGWIVYGWLDCSHEEWRVCLRALLEMRKELYRKHKIPSSMELHTTKYVNGRGEIQEIGLPSDTEWKTLGRTIAEHCLQTLRDCPNISIGSVYRHTNARGKRYAREREAVYAALVNRWDAHLGQRDEVGIVNMDGNGSDKSYFTAHRALTLNSRNLIEDPLFHDSKRSQLIQMADLVAWTTYAHLNKHSGNEYAANWYEDFLRSSDSNGGPLPI